MVIGELKSVQSESRAHVRMVRAHAGLAEMILSFAGCRLVKVESSGIRKRQDAVGSTLILLARIALDFVLWD